MRISSQHIDTLLMYLLVERPEQLSRVFGPYQYSFMRDMAAVSIHTSEANDPIESQLYKIDIRKNNAPVVECFPSKFFDFLYARKARFQIEDGLEFVGYTDGATWNGWAMPYFTRDVAEEVLKAYPGDEADDEDPYRNYSFPEEDSVIIVNPDDGKPLQVWPIGSGGWCWEECALKEGE